MRIVYAALVALAATAPQFIVRVPVAVTGVALNCADVTTRCVPSEYATIQAGMNAATAGDIVWVSAGTYTESISTPASGTAGNTITLLANGTVTACHLTFASRSYVRVIGLTFDPSTGGCSAGHAISGTGTNTGLEFWNITAQNTGGSNKAYSFDRGLGANECVSCIVMGGSASGVGNPSSAVAMQISGNDTFIGYVAFSTICYIGIGPSGLRQRMVNNNFSAMIQCGATHPDFFYQSDDPNGYSNNVIESTFGIGTPTASDNKFHHQEDDGARTWADNIYRLNVGTNIGSGVYSVEARGTGSVLRTRWYHNTWVLNDRATTASNACGSGFAQQAGTTNSMSFTNEIYQQCPSDAITTGIDAFALAGGAGTLSIAESYNLAFRQGVTYTFTAAWNAQTGKQSNVDPKLTNVAGNDFTLQSSSGARNVGGPLTTATSCSGTTLNVAANTATYFVPDNSSNLAAYGGLLVPGDTITVGTSTTRQIVSITGDAITVDASLTCAASDPIYFGSTSTIDIGAYPYKASGYALSGTYRQSGSTVTVTPNDATLARFAVVYENLMPKCIASAANTWACTVGSGVVSVTLYPRYASQTQSVAASGT